MFEIHCLESKTEKATNLFSKFCIDPLQKGQGITIGNALRRVMLSDLEGLSIIGVRIFGINHEFSTVDGIKEDVIDILLNLKQLVIKGEINEPSMARLIFRGPGIATANDIELPDNLSIVEPRQYIATVLDDVSLEMELLIEKGTGYSLSEKIIKRVPNGFLALDAVFMPVRKVNFFVETAKSKLTSDMENLILEVSTDGSITPIEAVSLASSFLEEVFRSLKLEKSIVQIPLVGDEQKQEFTSIMIEDLELSVRAYNCLKRSNVHTLKDLLQYSQEDLLELKNFGQKSASEVCASLESRFGQTLPKRKM